MTERRVTVDANGQVSGGFKPAPATEYAPGELAAAREEITRQMEAGQLDLTVDHTAVAAGEPEIRGRKQSQLDIPLQKADIKEIKEKRWEADDRIDAADRAPSPNPQISDGAYQRQLRDWLHEGHIKAGVDVTVMFNKSANTDACLDLGDAARLNRDGLTVDVAQADAAQLGQAPCIKVGLKGP